MTPEQMLAFAKVRVARKDLAAARVAYEVAPLNLDVVRLLAQAVRAEAVCQDAYVAAMTAGLAAQISAVVPNAFRD